MRMSPSRCDNSDRRLSGRARKDSKFHAWEGLPNGGAAPLSGLHRAVHKLEQLFRRGIAGQAKVVVEPAMVGIFRPEDLRGDAAFLEHGGQAQRLVSGLRIRGYVQNQFSWREELGSH